MLLKPERTKLRNLISEAVLLLCKNSCTKEFQNLSIEGLIGITFDEEDVVLVSFKDEASTSDVGKSMAIRKSPTVASSNHNAEKVAPQLEQEVIVVPTSCEQIVSIANSPPSVGPGALKRKRLRSFGDQNEKLCPTNYTAGNNPLPDSSIRPSSGYERTSKSDILPDDKSEIKIISSHTLADVDAAVRNSDVEFSSYQRVQQTLGTVDREISKPRRNSAGSNRPSSVKNETVSFSELGLEVSIKCEENSEDGDCVFIKSEILELGDNNACEFACDDSSHAVMSNSRMVNEESLFGDNLLRYSGSDDFGVEGHSRRSRNNQPFSRHRAKSQYPEYIQRGCDVQASSSSSGQAVQTVEDPTTLAFGSSRGDGPMECHICGAILKCRWNLNDHIQGLHLSQYRYKCPFCGRGFKWRSMLSYHKKICKAAMQSGFQR